jgi:hypothetical protein
MGDDVVDLQARLALAQEAALDRAQRRLSAWYTSHMFRVNKHTGESQGRTSAKSARLDAPGIANCTWVN